MFLDHNLDKKSLKKNIFGGSSLASVGALGAPQTLDAHAKKLDDHYRIMEKQDQRSSRHEDMLGEHNDRLDGLDGALDQHDKTLGEHFRIMEKQDQRSTKHEGMLGVHNDRWPTSNIRGTF